MNEQNIKLMILLFSKINKQNGQLSEIKQTQLFQRPKLKNLSCGLDLGRSSNIDGST